MPMHFKLNSISVATLRGNDAERCALTNEEAKTDPLGGSWMNRPNHMLYRPVPLRAGSEDHSESEPIDRSSFYLAAAWSRIVAAALLGAALLAGVAARVAQSTHHQYLCALSLVICALSAIHHVAMVFTRFYHGHTHEAEARVEALRYGNWWITLPLLGIKAHVFVSALPEGTFYLTSTSAAMLLLVAVTLGALLRFGCCEFRPSVPRRVEPLYGALLFITLMICFILVIVDLYQKVAYNGLDSEIARAVLVFVTVWWIYPLVALVAPVVFVCTGDSVGGEYPAWLSVLKDVAYGVADLLAKALFTLHTVQFVLT